MSQKEGNNGVAALFNLFHKGRKGAIFLRGRKKRGRSASTTYAVIRKRGEGERNVGPQGIMQYTRRKGGGGFSRGIYCAISFQHPEEKKGWGGNS